MASTAPPNQPVEREASPHAGRSPSTGAFHGREANLELEAAAFANFDDLESWRVYADWLLSVGDPHGELAILELARRDAFRSERGKFDELVAAKQGQFADAWREWAAARGLSSIVPKFKRGFVWDLTGPFADLEPVLDELFERDPIQRLSLFSVTDEKLAALCERKPAWFGRLRYLHLGGGLGAKGAAALTRVDLGRLERLNLLGNELDAAACGHLAKLATKQLRALTLTANAIDDDALPQLLGSPTRSQWRELYLSGNPITAAGIAVLAGTSDLEGLRALSLRDTEANFADFAPLIDASWPNMRKLELGGSYWWSAREIYERLRARYGAALKV